MPLGERKRSKGWDTFRQHVKSDPWAIAEPMTPLPEYLRGAEPVCWLRGACWLRGQESGLDSDRVRTERCQTPGILRGEISPRHPIGGS
jgi:hypothetical protein